ncbi:phage holin family protein [Oscillospiraceae bacterium PP1C4]
MNFMKGTFAAVSAFILARLGMLAPWAGVVIAAMVLDYITGMTAGWLSNTLSSRIGILGIIKKLCCFVIIAVAMMADWAIWQAGAYLGIQTKIQGFLALLIIIWLLINELISILENIGRIGVKYPEWLMNLLEHLKQTTESSGQDVLK